MAIFNLGSLNIDRVFRVPHIVAGGETLASSSLAALAGGKGANQSVALARAGATVVHVGCVGPDGHWLVDLLEREGVDTRWIHASDAPTGQAIIQVDDLGQNAIVLDGGANRTLTREQIDKALAQAQAGDWLLAQNETSGVSHALARARRMGLHVALNPAPVDDEILRAPWQQVDLLCVNELEAAALVGDSGPDRMLALLAERAPGAEIVLTLGAAGAMYRCRDNEMRLASLTVPVVDTTAAGDTFLGYFLASRHSALDPRQALQRAIAAAALCVTGAGAMDSIPRLEDVLALAGRSFR